MVAAAVDSVATAALLFPHAARDRTKAIAMVNASVFFFIIILHSCALWRIWVCADTQTSPQFIRCAQTPNSSIIPETQDKSRLFAKRAPSAGEIPSEVILRMWLKNYFFLFFKYSRPTYRRIRIQVTASVLNRITEVRGMAPSSFLPKEAALPWPRRYRLSTSL